MCGCNWNPVFILLFHLMYHMRNDNKTDLNLNLNIFLFPSKTIALIINFFSVPICCFSNIMLKRDA